MLIKDLNLPEKKGFSKRYQLSTPVDADVFERFHEFTKMFGHGAKKQFIEKAITNLLDQLEKN